MAADITFFLAPDDETAAKTRSSHPGRALTCVNCTGFDPDVAVVDWTAFFDGQILRDAERRDSGKWPRYVAEFLNDGVGVFVVSGKLVTALAAAGPNELRHLASYWGERLVEQNEHELTAAEQLSVVENVARLAGSTDGSGLYCWQW
ncbi:hypothetical protein [Lentzea sp.]|uniref:hypothetical protein n=1 Tax=Lentzea sp. TaxID=56099 RepID=UPI002C093EBB|nr:hypothetical protein [Lentzea sp.]HUQ54764.1 hypothetical protein [Lentzea sp.]